jgi:CheY-like chemotaxis protein
MSAVKSSERFEILVVEDNPCDVDLVRDVLAEANLGVTIHHADDGKGALDLLRRHPRLPDAILTDMKMPGMGVLELVEVLREEFPSVPVVLMTAYGSEEAAYQGLQKGASGYVPKKDLRTGLPRTLKALFELAHAGKLEARVLGCLVEASSTYVLDNDPSLILPVARNLAGAYRDLAAGDESDFFQVSVALYEALANAIYHGNLELDSVLRQGLSSSDFHRLAEARRRDAPYRDRRVHLTFGVTREQATFVVRDQGPGFDPSATADPLDRSNLDKATGRGLFLIRNFMDEVRHNESGNEITLVKRRAQQDGPRHDPHP